MLIVMKHDATQSDIDHVVEIIEKLGFRPHSMPGESRTAIGITGNQGSVDPTHFENLPGVADAIRVTKPYKLISKDLRPEKSIIKVGNATIGGNELAIIAGPCAIETVEQVFQPPNRLPKAARNFFAAARLNRALRPMLFREWVKTA